MTRFGPTLLLLLCLPIILQAVPVQAVFLQSANGEDEGAAEPPAQEPKSEEDRQREKRRIRQDLEQRKSDLPKEAQRTLKLLEDFRSRELRLWSVQYARIQAEGKAAVPALLLMLEETDWEVRAFAAAGLEGLRPAEALHPLLTALAKETKFSEARRRMVGALAALRDPQAEGALVRAAQDENLGISLAAVRGIGRLGRVESIPELRKHIKSKDIDIRYEVLSSLASLGDHAALETLQKKAHALVKTNDQRRYASLNALDMGDRYEQYLLGIALARANSPNTDKLLRDVLRAQKPWRRKVFLRLGAAQGLGRRAADGGPLHPELLKGLFHDDAPVRIACAYGLSFVNAPENLRKLKRALSDSQLDVRVNVVRAIGRIGTADAVKVLRRSLRDRSADVRAATTRALAGMPAPEAADALIRALKDKKYVNRVLAARGLGDRTAHPGVVAALTKAAKDADYGVRAQALASLSQATTQPAAALQVLMGKITDRDRGVRANACLGVNALLESLDDKPALDARFLQRVTELALRSPIASLQRAAQELLDAQRPPEAVPQLLDALAADKKAVRKRANSLLQRMSEKNMKFDAEGKPAERAEASRRWRSWWEETGELPARNRRAGMVVTGGLAEQTRDLKWRGLDLVLLLDCTGSMAGLLRSAKQSIDQIIEGLASPLPSLRISLFAYRDFGDDYVYYGTPLTFDLENLPGFLQSFVHGQGGDIPEAVFNSVNAAMKRLNWRKDAHKVCIFAGDAPHHPEQDHEFRHAIKKWATRENRAMLHALFTDTNRRSMDINRRKKREDPDDFSHPYFDIYRSIAKRGRGRGVLLSDESALIKEILVLAFGPEWRVDIENFLDFSR